MDTQDKSKYEPTQRNTSIVFTELVFDSEYTRQKVWANTQNKPVLILGFKWIHKTSQILNYHREHPCSYTRFQVDTQDKSKHDVTENIPFRMFYIECAREDEHMNSATLQKLSNSSYGFASPTLNITINMHHKSKTQQPTSPGLVAALFLETSNPSAYSSRISSRYQFFSTSSHPPCSWFAVTC